MDHQVPLLVLPVLYFFIYYSIKLSSGAAIASEAEETCSDIIWNEDIISKSTGSSVKLKYSSGPVLFNWFEAASCCMSQGLHLASPEQKKDLDSYKKFLGSISRKTKAWSDIQGFGKQWRNLKGRFISNSLPNFFWEPNPSEVTKGMCKLMEYGDAKGGSGDAGPLFVKDHPCTEDRTDVIYCEESDPKDMPVDYGCTFTGKWYVKWQWEAALSGKPPCKGLPDAEVPKPKPTYPKPKPTTESDIRNSDLAMSKGKLPWREAKTRCEAAGLMLLVLETQEDNDFLNNNKKFKQPPYSKNEFFWSGGRFASTDYTLLKWDPTKKTFPNFMEDDANGINKVWETAEPLDDGGEGKDLCVDMRFPGVSPPVWAASDCSKRKYYICIRPAAERTKTDEQATIDDGNSNEPVKPGGVQPLEPAAVDFSLGKASWNEAIKKCQKSNLVLMMIENEEDNLFLANSKRLKSKPFDEKTRFWSSGKFSEYDDAKQSHPMYWEPMHKEFKDPFGKNSNGVSHQWDDMTVGTETEKVCVDISFPKGQSSTSVWRVAECSERKYYICMRPARDRLLGKKPAPAQIVDNEETEEVPQLNPNDWTPSKAKQPWKLAQAVCQKSNMVLVAIETQEDNQILESAERLKKGSLTASTPFWSGGRFTSTEYTKLLWEPSKKEFPNFRSNTANGVRKQWAKGEPSDDSGSGKEVCVDIKFTNRGLPIWSAADCDERKHFICMRPLKDRITKPNAPPPKPLEEGNEIPDEPEGPVKPIKEDDVASSKSMLPWEEAKKKCQASGLVLLTIDSEDDNKILNFNKKLKQKPLSASTDFWSGGKFTSIEYTKMMWDPTKKEFPNFRDGHANGIKKWWMPGEPYDDSGVGNDLCVSMQFPGKSPPIWSASDCTESKYYICVRPIPQRNDKPKKPVTIFDPDAEEKEKELQAPLIGTFYPDMRSKKPIKGTMQPGKPQLFIPDNPSEAIKRMTPGTFIPVETPELQEFPFGAIHGNMRPYPQKKGASEFVPDTQTPGEFKPDSGVPTPGSMTPEGFFTPDAPPYITKPTPGVWKPISGVLPNHPCKTIHGTVWPGASKTDSHFVPDPSTPGSFTPDGEKNPIYGTLIQKNPPEFIPTLPNSKLKKPITGIWKPKPADPTSVSYGAFRPGPSGTSIFVPEEEETGIFVPDNNPDAPIQGSMTKNRPQIFTPFDPTDFSDPIPGLWKPVSGNPEGNRGVLRPNPNVPPESSLFEPDEAQEPEGEKSPPPNNVKPQPPKVPRPKPSFVETPEPEGTEPPPGVTKPRPPTVTRPKPGFVETPEPEGAEPPPGVTKPRPRPKPGVPDPKQPGGTKPQSPTIPKPKPGVPEPTKPSQGGSKQPSYPEQPIPGHFIPDSDKLKPIPGSMKKPDETPLFTPGQPVTRPISGTFKPDKCDNPEFPFQYVYHGTIRPYPAIKDTSSFLPDAAVVGEFIPDKGAQPIPGTMTQDPPSIFTPDFPPNIAKPTTGEWHLFFGVVPNHPCNTLYGKITPDPNDTSNFVFTPDPSRHGTFTPDNNPKKPVRGTLTQSVPPRFTPDSINAKFPKPTSGTWKPKPMFSKLSESHGTMKPTPNGLDFVPDEVIPGKFVPDDDPTNPMDGHMTKNPPQVFTPNDEKDLSKPNPGKFIPDNKGPTQQGTLKPDANLPINYAKFEPGPVPKPKGDPNFIPGNFYRDDVPKTPIDGAITKDPPYKFTPENPAIDLSDAPPGIWAPDNTTDPNDPFSGTMHGVMDQGVDGPVFIQDVLVDGQFIPDSSPNFIDGTMNMDNNPKLFTPSTAVTEILPSLGTWHPSAGSPFYPFSTLRGTLKPSPIDPGSGHFYPDLTVEGDFIPQGGTPVPGNINQGNPTIFTPDDPYDITEPIPGVWRPVVGTSGNFPHKIVAGTMTPTPDPLGGTYYIFVPFEKIRGIFTPDDPNSKPLNGQATQSNPTKFLPDGPSNSVTQPTSGTWKPVETYIPDDPMYYTHFVIFPPDDSSGKQIFFVPDFNTAGIFVPDNQPNNVIPGTLTKPQVGNRPVFKPDNYDTVIEFEMPGIFRPDRLQPGWFKTPVRGTLSPSKDNALPTYYVFYTFENPTPTPQKPTLPKPTSPNPEETEQTDDKKPPKVKPSYMTTYEIQAEFAPDEADPTQEQENCDPELSALDPNDRFYVPCGKNSVK